MKITSKIYLIALFFVTILSSAQEITNQDSTSTNSKLSIEMDAPVRMAIEKEEDKCELAKKNGTSQNSDSNSTPRTTTVAKTMTRSELCRRNPKILGYKILVGIRKSNKEANELKAEFRRTYPRMRTMTDASLRPNYKILAGSYLSRDSGKSDLRMVKRNFPGARLIQYQVYCVEAK